MNELTDILTAPELAFFRYALLAAILASVAFGSMGTFVVTRRISYLAGAIAHSALGGIGLALYLQRVHEISWLPPLGGALVVALLAAGILTLTRQHAPEHEDALIGALWVTGMSVGLILISLTPGYANVISYLFGNILMVAKEDLYLIAGLDAAVLLLLWRFYHPLAATCFDEEFASLRGLRTGFYQWLLLSLTAITIVLLVSLVGVILVIALLTLPAALAERHARSLRGMMIWASLYCLVFSTGGMLASYYLSTPSGPSIALLAAAGYLLGMLCLRKR